MADKPVRWRRRLLIALLLLVVVGWVGRAWFGRHGVAQGSWVLLDLEGGYGEDVPDDSLARLFGEHQLSLLDLLLLIRDAAEDPRVAGMVVRVRPLAVGWAKAQDIREALLALSPERQAAARLPRARAQRRHAGVLRRQRRRAHPRAAGRGGAGHRPAGAVRLPRRRLGEARHRHAGGEDPRVQDRRRHARQQGDVALPPRDGQLAARQHLRAARRRHRRRSATSSRRRCARRSTPARRRRTSCRRPG